MREHNCRLLSSCLNRDFFFVFLRFPWEFLECWSSSKSDRYTLRRTVTARVKAEEEKVVDEGGMTDWGKVSAVLFDMDGVLCNSEDPSRRAAVDVFKEMDVDVCVDDFVPFMGMGEAYFLGGVASAKGVEGFNSEAAKKRFFEIYLDKYAKPNSGIGFPGAFELISECKSRGLKVAVASSADRNKVDANLAAAGLSLSINSSAYKFDAIVSADAFENLKPAPDIFLAASKILDVPPSECVVIEDAHAGVQAAKAANMRCIAVTTTLSKETLQPAGAALIRKDIGNISIDDIFSGGPVLKNVKVEGSQSLSNSSQYFPTVVEEIKERGPNLEASSSVEVLSIEGLQGSRRDLIRYGSLGIAISCLAFTIANWKAMQYASPKAIWNLFFGINQPTFENGGSSRNDRIQQLMNYISDLESRGTAQTVPEFPPKLDWLNTAPLQLRKDLKGKVVLLDFWTYCCINCMHVLPDLEFLEKKYKDMPEFDIQKPHYYALAGVLRVPQEQFDHVSKQFTVIGVHSAKFDNEKDSEAIRSAVLRYDVTHPVVNDGDMYMWRELGVNSWPTFAIVGPNGKLLAQISGEGRRKDLDDLVEAALLFYGKRKMLESTTLPLSLEKDNDPLLAMSPLKFPGKLAVDVLNNRLFISDSNHNRIVVTDLDGNFLVQIGSSLEGLRDGNFDEVEFNRPQGLSYNAKKNLLYVADTENHALREIDFVNEKVRTLAGNGKKGSDYQGGGKGPSQLLNSPWDVCYEPINEIVYIALAGQHQIWKHNTADGVTKVFSGDGFERNLNGTSSTNTSFAQPSGLSLSADMKELYIADSESSSIRALDLRTGGARLLAGGDPVFSDNLFKFGDHDGIGPEVLLQHPLGVLCGDDGHIYIADSYNHKIKKLDVATRRVSTLAGTGKAGFADGLALTAQLSEPSGIVEAGKGRFLIADTNNSIIRCLELNMEVKLSTLELKGVLSPTLKSRSPKRLRRRLSADTQTITIDGSSSSEGNISLSISLPEGYHFSKEAPSKFYIELEPEDAVTMEPLEGIISPQGSAKVHFKRVTPAASVGKIYCKVYYCKEDEVCLYQSLAFEVPFQEVQDSKSSEDIQLAHCVKPRTFESSLPQAIAR